MKLRQKYQISGKPFSLSHARILSDKLNKEAKEDVDALLEYLLKKGTIVGTHHLPSNKYDISDPQIDRGSTYYHLYDGLTIGVHVLSYGKEWNIEKKKSYLPKEIDVSVDIFGKGSKKLRQDIRKNVFDGMNMTVIKSS